MSWPDRLKWTRTQASEMGRKGGRKAALKTRERMERLWQTRFPGVTLEAVQAIYKRGYGAGYIRGWQRSAARIDGRSFDAGYRQAQLDVMPRRRSA